MAQHPQFPNLHVLDHPLIQHKLTHMRDVRTSTRGFRALLKEVALLMGYEVTRGLPLACESIRTPLVETRAPVIAGKKLCIVPILRAGMGMADGLLELVPAARVGHVGLYRDPATHRPVEYLVKLPEPQGRTFIIVDPMLATGNSAVHAVDVVKRHGAEPGKLLFLALIAAPEGMAVFSAAHPDVPVYVAALDDRLDEDAYILPGLGDAGDRLFGTK